MGTLNYWFAKSQSSMEDWEGQMIEVIHDASVLKFVDQLKKVSLKYSNHIKSPEDK